jgi:transposase-like protein
MTRGKNRVGREQPDRRSELRGGRGRSYPVELRIRVVQEVLERGTSRAQVTRLFGICSTTIQTWIDAYRRDGVDGLVPRMSGPPPQKVATPQKQTKTDAVTSVRAEHPEYGTRRIRDVLARFEAPLRVRVEPRAPFRPRRAISTTSSRPKSFDDADRGSTPLS